MRKKLTAAILLTAIAAFGQAHTPTLVVNNSTGSDTTASGAPSTFGPFSAVATCHTGGVGSFVIQWVANPLAGVPTDGTAILWLATASGRRFSEITARAVDTVTVEESFNIAGGSPVDCAVGGKRATLSATRLVADVKAEHSGGNGWTVQIENTGVNYTTGAQLTCTAAASGGCRFLGTGTPRPIIESTANVTTLSPGNCDVQHLHFINTSGVKTTARALTLTSSSLILVSDNIFGSSGQGHQAAINSGASIPLGGTIFNNEFRFNTIGYNGRASLVRFLWNYIHDNGTGIEEADAGACGNQNTCGGIYYRNLIVNNTGDGVRSVSINPAHWVENVVDGNGGDGFDFGAFAAGKGLINNQITNNTGFGTRCNAGTTACGTNAIDIGINIYNNYFGNGSGARENWIAGENETAVNPGYVDRPGGNYCPTAFTNRGGPPGLGETIFGTNTGSFLSRGACQLSGAGGRNLGI